MPNLIALLACTLGYLIDAYDLVLFSVVRVASLKSMGVPEDQLLSEGIFLINVQMAGLVIGGLIFGMLGDKFGRTKILFATIGLYSITTFANAFVTDVSTYAVLRFLAGLGMAGELGLAVTLLSELVAHKNRAYAAAIIAGFGMIGAVLAGLSARYFDWQACYIAGGIAGAGLLILRAGTRESLLFEALTVNVTRGGLRLLISTKERLRRFILCILVGTPIPFIFWMLIAFSPEFTKQLGLSTPLSAGEAIIYGYIGLAMGDLLSPLISEWMKSRRNALLVFQGLSLALCFFYLAIPHPDSPHLFRLFYFLLGLSGGYWTLLVLIAAENFGTNLRATVATSVPNLARAAAVPMGIALPYLKEQYGLIDAALIIGGAVFSIAMLSAIAMKTKFGESLDYIEK